MTDTTTPAAELTLEERRQRQRKLHDSLVAVVMAWLRDEHGLSSNVVGKDDKGENIHRIENMSPEINGDMAIVLANVTGSIIAGAAPALIDSMVNQAVNVMVNTIERHPQQAGGPAIPNRIN